MARRGRPRKTREQKLRDALERTKPAQYILERRRLFSFVEAPKGGEVDSEICDAIGQMCVLGLLDGNGHDPVELRDKGRFWGQCYARVMGRLGNKAGGVEPKLHYGSAARQAVFVNDGPYDGADMLFDKMDANLPHYERVILLTLLVDPLIGHGETVAWAQALIDEALLKRKRIPKAMIFPTLDDRAKLKAAIRGLSILVDGSLPHRYAA